MNAHVKVVNGKVEGALETLKRGLSVFPLTHTKPDGSCSCGDPECRADNKEARAGKHPRPGSNGYKDASFDEAQVRKWWTDDPEANIGACPGDDYVIIDLDIKPGKDGLKELSDYIGMSSDDLLGLTYTVRTQSGGFHLYFEADAPFATGAALLPCVDVRAVGGYVLAPGSTIADRSYSVSNAKGIAAVQADIKAFLRTTKPADEDRFDPLLVAGITPRLPSVPVEC